MAATTISRTAWTDGASGTLLDNAAKTALYDEIDGLFTSAFNFGDILNVEGLGTHLWSGSGTGGNVIRVRNSTGGATNYSGVQLGNDTDADAAGIELYASSFTETGAQRQDGLRLFNVQDGGISIAAEHASGAVRLYAGGTTAIATFDGDTIILSGGTPGTYALAGVLDRDSTQGGNAADTAYITRWTPTALPANTLDTDGQRLRIVAVGTTAPNANTKRCRINFGSQAITFTWSGAGTGGGQWRIEAEVIRTGSSAQKIFSTAVYEGDGGNYNYTPSSNESYFETTEDLTASVTITVQVQSDGATANDTVYEYGYIEFWP